MSTYFRGRGSLKNSTFYTVPSSGNSMTVIFRSDGNVSGRGFHATYRTIKGNIATRTEYLYVKMRCIYAACISKLAV